MDGWNSVVCWALLALACYSTQAMAASLTTAPAQKGPEIQISQEHGSHKRAVSEEELQELLRDNLHVDLLPWQSSSRPKGALKALDFLELLHEIDTQWPPYKRNFIAIVVIRNNNFTYWSYPTARSWCIRRVKIACEEFQKYIDSHSLQFPDVMYVMNGYDKPLCKADNCSAPIFSYGKCWRPAMPGVACPVEQPVVGAGTAKRPGSEAVSISASLMHTAARALRQNAARGAREARAQVARSSDSTDKQQHGQQQHSITLGLLSDGQVSSQHTGGEGRQQTGKQQAVRRSLQGAYTPGSLSPYDDILFPVMNHPFDHMVNYPWDNKVNAGFMRAGIYAAMAVNNSRLQLYNLAREGTADGMLNVGIYQNRHWRVRVKTVPPVPIEEHAHYRYLINTDGQAASWRLAKLLAINSAILKWRSPHIEYYYRSLKAGTHFVDVDTSDVVEVLKHLQQPEQQEQVKRMVDAAQSFAYRYLSQLSRSAYARSALKGYHDLFAPGEMQVLLNTVGANESPSMLTLLQLRDRLLSQPAAN